MAENNKIAFLFGAGVEVDYGFPLGGELSLRLLISKEIDKGLKDKISRMLSDGKISKKKYFTIADLRKIGKSIIKNRQDEIEKFFKTFDERINKDFPEYIIEENYVEINQTRINKKILNDWISSEKPLLKAIGNFFAEIILLVFGEKILTEQQNNLYKTLSLDIEQNKLFKIDFSSVSLFTSPDIEDVFKNLDEKNEDKKNEDEKILKLFKELVETAVDFQELLKDLYPAILSDDENNEFVAIAVILFRIQEIINDFYKNKRIPDNSYYKDLRKWEFFENCIFATTNYTNLILDETEVSNDKVFFLNGNVNNYFDISDSEIKSIEDIDKNKKYIPYIFTQTTLKPLFCVDMMKPFVDFLKEAENSDILCILGYAGNKDDVIVNSIIHKLLKQGKKVIYFNYEDSIKDEQLKANFKLNQSNRAYFKNIKVDKNRKVQLENDKEVFWLDYIKAKIGGIQ